MTTKRIIPCLDIKDGQVVKGVNFENLIQAGDPVELAKHYCANGADELVFLDITATIDKRKTFVELVKKLAKEVTLPFAVGGGIGSIEDVKAVLEAGANKVGINSAAVKNPQLLKDCVEQFGSKRIVSAIDAKKVGEDYHVLINAGKTDTGIKLVDWAKEVESYGVGEILLTSLDQDGVQQGFDIEMTGLVCDAVNIPVIASGGAGPSSQHFIDVFEKTNVDAALAASIFHFNTLPVETLKADLKAAGISVR